MFALIRKNKRPTALRHLVSALYRDMPVGAPVVGALPSHHILCAGTYSPVFARLAAESALAACPAELRPDFRLFIHVDGIRAGRRADYCAWLKEIPGVEVTYGRFGILSRDRIPGKWHQVMINDIVRDFSTEKNVAFIDADLFMAGHGWFEALQRNLAERVFSVTVGLRPFARFERGGEVFQSIRTQLFTVNTALYRQLNTQRCNKDARAVHGLRTEYPDLHFSIERPDTMIVSSLRAQAQGLAVIDVRDQVRCCHVGGFSHMGYNKFHDFERPDRRQTVTGLLGQARLLSSVLEFFDRQGWGRFVDQGYRLNEQRMRAFIASHAMLQQWSGEIPPTAHEQVFAGIVAARG